MHLLTLNYINSTPYLKFVEHIFIYQIIDHFENNRGPKYIA